MTLIGSQTELVVEQCWCGIWHAVPQRLIQEQDRQFHNSESQRGIYCPLGHSWVRSGQSKYDRLNQQLQRERSRHDQTKAELRETESRRRAEKGAKTKIKKRIAAGICPSCRRPFANLMRHMKNQHPNFLDER